MLQDDAARGAPRQDALPLRGIGAGGLSGGVQKAHGPGREPADEAHADGLQGIGDLRRCHRGPRDRAQRGGVRDPCPRLVQERRTRRWVHGRLQASASLQASDSQGGSESFEADHRSVGPLDTDPADAGLHRQGHEGSRPARRVDPRAGLVRSLACEHPGHVVPDDGTGRVVLPLRGPAPTLRPLEEPAATRRAGRGREQLNLAIGDAERGPWKAGDERVPGGRRRMGTRPPWSPCELRGEVRLALPEGNEERRDRGPSQHPRLVRLRRLGAHGRQRPPPDRCDPPVEPDRIRGRLESAQRARGGSELASFECRRREVDAGGSSQESAGALQALPGRHRRLVPATHVVQPRTPEFDPVPVQPERHEGLQHAPRDRSGLLARPRHRAGNRRIHDPAAPGLVPSEPRRAAPQAGVLVLLVLDERAQQVLPHAQPIGAQVRSHARRQAARRWPRPVRRPRPRQVAKRLARARQGPLIDRSEPLDQA